MPKRSNAFQTLVAQIQHHFGLDSDYLVEESRFLKNSATGKSREVDIVVEGVLAKVPLFICFECCTSASRKAGSPWVENMIGKHQNLPTHRLILVSETGFSKPALKAVECEKDVEAVTLDEATEVDWSAYAKNFSSLRFGGFELRPLGIHALWKSPLGIDTSDCSLDSPTVFRRLEDGVELTAFELSLDIVKNEELGRLVMDRYFTKKKATAPDSFSDQNVHTFEEEFKANWDPEIGTWVVCFSEATCVLQRVTVTAKAFIRDTPMSLSYKSFMGVKVAHATVEKPFPNINKNKGEELVVAITQAEEEHPVASVSFTKEMPGLGKTFFAKVAEAAPPDSDESENGDS